MPEGEQTRKVVGHEFSANVETSDGGLKGTALEKWRNGCVGIAGVNYQNYLSREEGLGGGSGRGLEEVVGDIVVSV